MDDRTAELENIDLRIEALSSEREKVNAELLELGKRKSALEAEIDIARRVAKFTDAEKAALFQEIRAQGVPSAERVGTPTT